MLKGDRLIKVPSWAPLKGDDWFLVAGLTSDTVVEPRSFPILVGVQTTGRPDSIDTFGHPASLVLAQTVLASAALIKGSTAYKPPEIEYRVTLAAQLNYVNLDERRVLNVKPSTASHRTDMFVGVQELFVDRHLRNTSDRYDFDPCASASSPSSRTFAASCSMTTSLGCACSAIATTIASSTTSPPSGVWRRTRTAASTISARRRATTGCSSPISTGRISPSGFTSQISVTYNMNREAGRIEVDKNGFPVRPALFGNLRARDYDVVYLGYSGDGHFGRINLTTSLYAALGQDRDNVFTLASRHHPRRLRGGRGELRRELGPHPRLRPLRHRRRQPL